jgi:hypothetical protein
MMKIVKSQLAGIAAAQPRFPSESGMFLGFLLKKTHYPANLKRVWRRYRRSPKTELDEIPAKAY